MRAPIKSKKHYRQYGVSPITTGASESILLVDANNGAASDEVEEGCIVKAVFVELWLNNDGVDGQSIVTVTKGIAGDSGPTFAEMADLFTYNNKKNILFTHQGLTSNESVGNPIRVLNGWIKIPKSKQRFGLGDRIALNISNTSSGNLFRCGFAIYKEYT